jgi:hypothetical protein
MTANKNENVVMTPASSITMDKPLTRDTIPNAVSGRVDGFTLTGQIKNSITLEKKSENNTTD